MEFRMRYGSTFMINLTTMIFAITAACFGFFAPVFKSGFLHYNYIIWLLLAATKFLECKNYIPFALSDKPVLYFNDSYIYDIPNNRKYYWKDVKDITKKYYITLLLNDPSDHLQLFSAGINRWWAKYFIKKGKSPYIINTDVVDANDRDLFAVLNEYKTASQNKNPDTTD